MSTDLASLFLLLPSQHRGRAVGEGVLCAPPAPRSVSRPELLPESLDQLQSPRTQVGLLNRSRTRLHFKPSASGFENLSNLLDVVLGQPQPAMLRSQGQTGPGLEASGQTTLVRRMW